MDSLNQKSEALPHELHEFLDRAIFMPQEFSDADIQGLQNLGCNDKAILEFIHCSAVAAGMGRLEIVVAAMQGKASGS